MTEARRFWRSPITLAVGVAAVLVGIVVVMSSRADAPVGSVPTIVGTVPGQPPPSVTASPAQRALLDAAAPPSDLGAFGLVHRERTAHDEWIAIDAYLCSEVLEAETLSRLAVLDDDYGDGGRWLKVSYIDTRDGSELDRRTAGYRDPRRRCDWDDAFNEAIEPFDVQLRDGRELYGFTSGDGAYWVVTAGQGRAGLVWSNDVDVDAIEKIALVLLADGPLAGEPGGAAATSVP